MFIILSLVLCVVVRFSYLTIRLLLFASYSPSLVTSIQFSQHLLGSPKASNSLDTTDAIGFAATRAPGDAFERPVARRRSRREIHSGAIKILAANPVAKSTRSIASWRFTSLSHIRTVHGRWPVFADVLHAAAKPSDRFQRPVTRRRRLGQIDRGAVNVLTESPKLELWSSSFWGWIASVNLGAIRRTSTTGTTSSKTGLKPTNAFSVPLVEGRHNHGEEESER